MQIQKLIYLAQGYHLYHYDTPIINEVFQAWKFGPVLRSIYHECKNFGRSGINEFLIEGEFMGTKDEMYPFVVRPAPIPENKEVNQLIDFIWETYSKYDPLKLSQWTHEKGGPWDKVTNGGKDILLNMEVPNKEIQDYFKRKLDNA